MLSILVVIELECLHPSIRILVVAGYVISGAVLSEIVHSPGVYFTWMTSGASQLDRFEPTGGGHGIDNRRVAPAADMETWRHVEELEQVAVAREKATSSDGESEVRGSTDRTSVGLSPAS